MSDAAAITLKPAARGIGSAASHLGPAPKRIVVGYGFWIFLLSDFIVFASLFATFGVLVHNTAGGPTTHDLFELKGVAIETAALLLSSFACGMASIAAGRRQAAGFHIAMLITAAFGAIFLAFEMREFYGFVAEGAGPQRSAFLSSFFTLVGCHGLHVSLGMLWLFTMMAQVFAKGFRPDILRRLLCFSLFWHALDIIWVGIFTAVYLYGVYL
jgi:cytochrome o ubiquinol oxidase subunit III